MHLLDFTVFSHLVIGDCWNSHRLDVTHATNATII